jgi:hypothetical protein
MIGKDGFAYMLSTVLQAICEVGEVAFILLNIQATSFWVVSDILGLDSFLLDNLVQELFALLLHIKLISI